MAAIWEDREIRFNSTPKSIRLRQGETVKDAWSDVKVLEKFGGGEQEYNGRLVVTDLRVMWQMYASAWLNISLGYHCISGITTSTYTSKFYPTAQKEINIRAQWKKKYLLSFVPGDSKFLQVYSTVCTVNIAYNSSRVYRNLLLRGAVTTEDDQLSPLPKEQILNIIDGFWNLSSSLGNLGVLYVTNVRIVWISKANKHYNGSIPYIRMKSINEVITKYGFTMTIRLTKPYGDLVFAFQTSPDEKLKAVAKEIRHLAIAAQENPIFGVFVEARENVEIEPISSAAVEEDTEVDETTKLNFLAVNALADESAERKPAAPVFSKKLGIAVETLPSGFTVESLWKVL